MYIFRIPAFLLLFFCIGCHSPEAFSRPPTPDPARTVLRSVRADVPEGVAVEAGRSVESRPIQYQVHGRGPEVMLIFSTIHGDEPAGTPLVKRLGHHLALHPEVLAGRRVVLCPLVNPDGLARRSRWNAQGVDLNRNYPTANFRPGGRHGPRPLSEPESRVLMDLIQVFRPCRVLIIHQPLACIDHDGPARGLAEAMHRHASLPVKKLGARPGSLGSYVGVTLGIPIITLELPDQASQRSLEDNWARYGSLLLAFVLHPDPVRL